MQPFFNSRILAVVLVRASNGFKNPGQHYDSAKQMNFVTKLQRLLARQLTPLTQAADDISNSFNPFDSA